MNNFEYLIGLILSLIILIIMAIVISTKTKKKDQIRQIFIMCLICMILWVISLSFQILFQNFSINPIVFEGFASFGACFIPIVVMFLGIVFSNTRITFKKTHLLLFIIPVISTVLMFTNEYHNLFFYKYSTNMKEIITGPYHSINAIYSYTCIFIGLFYLLKFSIKNSGFFSKQSIPVFLGILIPGLTNILGTFGLINMTVYMTPLTFTFSILCFGFAIFKFDFLKVAPIALQRIVDRISDSYVVVNEDNVIIDFNETFLKTFKVSANDVRNKELFDLFKKNDNFNMTTDKLIKDTDDIKTLEKYFANIDKYFHIEITRIESKGNFLGTLILFKDITQHTIDMQTIKDNQDMLVEKERLASLGQMIGGIAHNLKTPIMSIAGAAEGLSDLIKEYDASIGDPEVTSDDHHEIAKDMQEWIEKIRTHLSYMSDVITAIKGQAVAFSEQTASGFTIKELINYIDILMKHELKNGLTNLKTRADIDTSTVVKGNINSLVQVINNIISNAIQAYQEKGKSNQDINFTIYKDGNNIVFKIEDFAGGLPQKVQNKLFKEMSTTKGKNGTGLGLFMSYSNIKAHFSGSMDYETEKGKGTTFYISIPV